MSDSKKAETALDQGIQKLSRHGFSQDQWKDLIEVFGLAKDHPAFDDKTATVVLERIERKFARVRDDTIVKNQGEE